jgi:adenine deaminase
MTQVDLHIHNARILDVFNQQFEASELWIDDGRIVYRGSNAELSADTHFDAKGRTIVPGLIDAHMHIESSLLAPSEFAKVALQHGITRIVADPHEIASVAGISGIQYMLEEARQTPLNIHYMLPSSVPATPFERAGAILNAAALKPFYAVPEVNGLAEVMDYPAVANSDADMLAKIADTKAAGKHIDGHGSGLTRQQLSVYRQQGIDTDHESTTAQQALDRIQAGMAVLIREGTVERDEKALLPAVNDANWQRFAFATDDKSAIDLSTEGSIDYNVKLAIREGIAPQRAYTMASFNAARAHHLENVGALSDGYVADLIVLSDVENVTVDKTMVAGQWIDTVETSVLPMSNQALNFTLDKIDLSLPISSEKAHVIAIEPHHITTQHLITAVPTRNGLFQSDTTFAKIVVAERYRNLGQGVGIIKGFNLTQGAIGSTIAHDSHNVVIAGHDDDAILLAADTLKEMGGGMVVVDGSGQVTSLPLPIGGLMSDAPYAEVIAESQALQQDFNKISDVRDFDPFLTLSFMALPVIPSLKITDQGLFDFEQFRFIDINA